MVEYSVFSVMAVSSNPSTGPSPKTEISFYLLSVCVEEPLSVPNIITFLPNPLPSQNENFPRASKKVPYPG